MLFVNGRGKAFYKKAAQIKYLNSFVGNVAREGVEPSTSGL
jgi:hypothetical protein